MSKDNKYEFTPDKCIPINDLIEKIEKNYYIDIVEGYEDDFEFDSILYYLKENRELKERIDEVVEYIKFIVIHKDAFNEQSDAFGFVKLSQTIWGEELLETLEGDK